MAIRGGRPMKGSVFFLAIFFLFTSCTPTLSGVLVGEKGEFVSSPEARVNISCLSTQATQSDQSSPAKIFLVSVSNDGEFYTRESLEPGSYLVEALVPGYKATSVKINVPHAEKVKLNLTPLKNLEPLSIDANPENDAGKGAGTATLTPPQF